MGQWISSREFAEKYNIGYHALKMACIRSNKKCKKICTISSYILHFTYIEGIGRGGKILQIWNTPLTPSQVEALEKGYPIKYVLEEMGSEQIQPNVMESLDSKTLDCQGANNETTKNLKETQRETLHPRGLNPLNKSNDRIAKCCDSAIYWNDLSTDAVAKSSADKIMDCHTSLRFVRNDAIAESHNHTLAWHNLTLTQKQQAKQREQILLDYESAKSAGIKVAHFIELKNKEDSTLKLTQGKLFDWQRKYKTQGLSALSDKRGIAKLGTTSLPAWAQEEAIKLWRTMGSGYFNRMQLWRELHLIAPLHIQEESKAKYSYEKFLKCEIPPLFSLNTLNRFLDSYFKANSLEYTLIIYGEDKTDSYKEPAYGIQRELYTLPNQLWQMDSSPLDAIVLDSEGKQIRPSILSIVDVYSGRSVASLSETSDSNAVVRLLWKAFESMGKPQAIQFDNGKDYLSNKVQGLLEGLGDTINHISDNSAAKASEITEVLQRIGGTAKVMGLSAENAAALGSAFIAMGKAPEVAGTAINSLFTKLLAPEKQTAGFRNALEEIGLSAEELKDSIQNNPQKGLEDFLQTLTEVEKSEQMGILSSLFGAEFGDDMALLVSGMDNYKKAVSLANDKNKVDSLQREFETRAATTENALTLLKSSVLNLGITIGSILLPPLNGIISVINPIINGFAALCERFPKISGVVVGAVAAFGSFIVASAGYGKCASFKSKESWVIAS